MARLASVFVLLLLGGCVAKPVPPAESPSTASWEPLEIRASDCAEVDGYFFIDPGHAQSLLPDGFVAADASLLFGAPAPTGKGGVFVGTIVCGPSSLDAVPFAASLVAVIVQPPDVAGERPAATNMYELAHGTSSPLLRERLQSLEWPVFADAIASAVTEAGVVAGSGSASDQDGEVFSLSVDGPPRQVPVQGTFRWWHDAPAGLSYFDYEVDLVLSSGAGSCSIRAGSVVAEATGVTSCGPDTALIMAAAGHDEVLRVEHLPGVHAGP